MGKFRGYDDGIGRLDRKIADLRRQMDVERAALKIRSSTIEVDGDTLFTRGGVLYFRAPDGSERTVVPLAPRTAPIPNNNFESVDANNDPTDWNGFWSSGDATTESSSSWYTVGSRSMKLTSGPAAGSRAIAGSEVWRVPAGVPITVTLDATGSGTSPQLEFVVVTNVAGGNPNFFASGAATSSTARFLLDNSTRQYEYQFTIPQTHTLARLFLIGSSGNTAGVATVLVDNVGIVGGAADTGSPLPGVAGAHIGDSISDRNGPWGYGERGGNPNTSPYYPQLAWFQHAAIAAGQRVTVPPVQNFAVSGKRTDEMFIEQVPLLLNLSPRPTFSTVLGGTNDIGQGRTAAQIIASLTAIYDALAAASVVVIAGTIPPSTAWDAPKLAILSTVNRWIKAQAGVRTGFYVVDFFTVLADTAGAPKPGVLADGTHQTGKGAAIMGAALAPVLTTLFPPFDPFPGPGDGTHLAANPFQTGTAGAKGTGVTGSVATGWFVATADAGTVTVTASKVARTDSVPGEWTQLAITSGNVRFLSEVAITSGFAVGDQVQALVEFQTDANADTSTTQLEAYIVSTGSTNTAGTLTDTPGFDGTEVAWTRLPRSGVMRTPPMVVGLGTTGLALWVRIWGGAGGTFRIGRAAIVKL